MSHLWDIWGTSEKRDVVRAESGLWDIYGTYDNPDALHQVSPVVSLTPYTLPISSIPSPLRVGWRQERARVGMGFSSSPQATGGFP